MKTQTPHGKGYTLVEILVAIALISLTLIIAAATAIQSRRAMEKSERLQAARAYAVRLIEEMRSSPPAELPLHEVVNEDIILGKTHCRVSRDVTEENKKEGSLWIRVTVNMEWKDSSPPAIFSRIIHLRR